MAHVVSQPEAHPGDDVFGTAALRRRVLDAWRASPARFREDANAEEDLALGAYRDRLVVELAQNAADAASRAGVPGRLRLTLRSGPDGGVLVAANTGAPLDAAGVEALSTLRASAKREGPSVGRFGVGFAAVLAVSDEPCVLSRRGGVRWSRADAHALASTEPALAAELARREDHVPVLRLPFAAEGSPPVGYDTAVVLPLRDAAADDVARRFLDGVDDALLLALDGLAEVDVEIDGAVRALTARRDGPYILVDDDGTLTRWQVVRRSGRLDPAVLADRPTEERARPAWSVTWAVPVDDSGRPRPLPATTPSVVHAPTPSDEALGLPALLLATFPLDPARRHVAPGPLRDFLVGAAARAYTDLLRELPADPDLRTLIPGPLPIGELDGELRRAVLALLPDVPFLPAADDPQARLRPREACAVFSRGAEGLSGVLAPVLSGVLPTEWARDRGVLGALGVRILELPDVIESLGGLRRVPAWWRGLYDALAGAEPESLRGLPVPLADGRLVGDPRGVFLPTAECGPDVLLALGLRTADPEAAHPLLERLGAVLATPAAVLADPAVRTVAERAWDADDVAAVTDAVLGLVAAAAPQPGELPWLADLPLRDAGGELGAAGELLLPGSPLSAVVEPDALGVVSPELVERWGAQSLEAVGVLRTFALVRDADVVLDPDDCDHDLDAEDEWVFAVRARLTGTALPSMIPEYVAVRDLELVSPVAWEGALRLLAEPPLRDAVVEPTRVLMPDGRLAPVPSYAAWWLRHHPVLRGHRPVDLRLAGSDPLLAGLYEEAGGGLDPGFARALGLRVSLDELLAEPGGPDQLVDRLADPGRVVGRDQLAAVYAALAQVSPDRVQPRSSVRVPAGGGTRVEPAAHAVVVDAPDLLPLLDGRPAVPAPSSHAAELADVLGLPLAGEELAAAAPTGGTEVAVPPVVRRVLPAAPASYVEHDRLEVAGRDLEWRYADGVVHASTSEGLACGLAWASGSWGRRFLVAAVLDDSSRVEELLAQEAFG
jgi:hypothetical protein